MPAYCADSGLDADYLWVSIQAAEFIPRSDRSALYSGHELPRSKIYVADTPAGSWPVYKFPGFQYRAVLEHYKRLHAVPWPTLRAFTVGPELRSACSCQHGFSARLRKREMS